MRRGGRGLGHTGVGMVGQGGGRALVVQFLSSGALDASFSGNGWHAFNPSTRFDAAWDLDAQADGAIVGVGCASDDAQALLFRVDGTPPG